MCGRARLSTDVSEIKIVFSIPPHRPTPNFPPSWNVAPTDPLPVVRYDRKPASAASISCVGAWCRIGHQGQFREHQRDGGNRRHKAGFPRGIPAASLFAASRQLLRMAENRHRQTAVCDHAGRPMSHGLGRPVGELALAGG
jgi:hypothetical protein